MISEPGRVRTTISIDSEVYEIFKRMAEISDVSISRCMGNWLAETADGAQFVTQKMAEVRKAPMNVMRELHVNSDFSGTAVNSAVERIRRQGQTGRSAGSKTAAPAGSGPLAPSSNTGLKSPAKTVSNRK
jgi:hypothetical protein